MKKLLTLFTLLVLCVTGAWATDLVWDFTDRTATSFENGKSYSFLATNGTTEMRYSAGSSDAIVAKNNTTPGYLKENGKTGGGTVKDIDGETNVGKTRLIRLYVTGNGKLTINCNGTNGTYKVLDGSASGTQLIESLSANTQSSEITVSNFLWIETTTKGYITTIEWTPSAPATPTLTGAWKVGGETVTEGAINIGGDVPGLSLDVNATSGTPESSDYTITYSMTGDDVVEITGEGSGFTLKNNVTGSATLTATVTSNDESKFLDAAENYSYTYTVNRVDNSNLAVTPATGTYVGKTTVTMTYEDGYTVYYTTDGSDPEEAEGTRSTYSAPFDVTSTTTVKAIPYIAADGYGNVVERTYTINAPATPTFTPGAGAVLSGTEISISSTDGDATIYYTTDGTVPSNTNGTAYDTDAKPTITDATTIKAISYVNGVASAVAEATYTKIVLDEQTDITGSTEWDWTTVTAGPGELTGTLRNADIIVSNLSKLGVTAITAPSEFDQTGLLINGQYAYRNANGTKLCQVNYLKFNTTVPGILRIEYANTGGNDTRTVCVEVNEGTPEYGTHSSNGNAYSATPEDNKYVIDEFNVSAGTIKIKGVLNNDHSTDKMLRIRKVTFIETVPVEVSALGYATFASDEKLDFTGTSISAYKATVTGTTVNFTQVNVVPAGEGVLLYADGGESINVPVTTADADDFTDNKLVRGTGDALTYAAGTAEYYILANETAGIGFYKANNNKVATNRAYLDLTGTNAKSFTMPGGETDGIRSIDNSELRIENSNYYNLAGQRVGKDYKGIVIVNGKKMLNK